MASPTLPASLERATPVLREGVLESALALFRDGFKVHLDYTCAAASSLDLNDASLLRAWSAHQPNTSIWWDKYGAEAFIPHMIRTTKSVLTDDYREAHASASPQRLENAGTTSLKSGRGATSFALAQGFRRMRSGVLP